MTNEQDLKASIDRFLRNVSFTAQREIEKVVRAALANGTLKPGETLSASITLSSPKVGLDVTIHQKLDV
jgi:hypothetical protein